MFNFLDNIDIYIQPSLTEGLPRALIEAMSGGFLQLVQVQEGYLNYWKTDILLIIVVEILARYILF